MNRLIEIIFTLLVIGLSGCSSSGDQFAVYQAGDLEDGAFLHDFLLLGPFPNPLPEGVTDYFHTDEACLGFAKDYLEAAGGEEGVKPRPGGTVEIEQGETFTWISHHTEYDQVDLRKLFSPNEGVVSYAALWIESERKQEKLLGIGSNDGIKVWLNGEMILNVHKPRPVRPDDEYLRLELKRGKNLLLLKIEQGYGGWGFMVRPVDGTTAWNKVQENLDVAMNSEFYLEDGLIKGTIGDPQVVGMLRGLPRAELEFRSIHSDHIHKMAMPLGTRLELPVDDFPGKEYAISITFPTDKGSYSSYAYLSTGGDVIEKTRALIYKELPELPPSVMADHFNRFMETTRWLDQTNKLWQHPYGYRRYLDGLQFVHTAAQALIEQKDPFMAVFPPPLEKVLTGEKCTVTTGWKICDPGKEDDFITSELERVWRSLYHSAPAYTNDPGQPNTIHLEQANTDLPQAKTGKYVLRIEPEQIVITAATRQGHFYGLNTLLQTLEQQTGIPSGTIRDKPKYPLRSTLQTVSQMTPEFREYIEQIARLRYNVVYIYSNNYLNLEDEQVLENTREVFEFCKSRFIEPVPYFESFGAGTITRIVDPCLDEGIYHEKEPWTVPGNGIIELNVPRIQDCPGTTLHLFTKEDSGTGESAKSTETAGAARLTELLRGTDFKIVSTEKPVIQILNEALLNTEVLLSYDAVDFSLFPHPASCPSDPHGWEIMEEVISGVITKLQPKSLHISQDEAGLINSCSRCLARGMSNREIMIDQIDRVHGIIRKYDPEVDICIWGDLFSDLQNAPMLGTEGAIEGLPKDILIHDWNYVAVYHSDKMQTMKQLGFYLDRGYRAGGVAWFEPANIVDILQVGEQYGSLFTGIMHSAWSGFNHSLYPVAEANWTGRGLLGNLAF
ncbi:MAG: glycoside hydrolase family 20 zincin-like fold domain-containing protein [Bacteroidota bacterium]